MLGNGQWIVLETRLNMTTILLTNHYEGKPLEIVRGETPAGFELSLEGPLGERIAGADYILAGGRTKITRALLEKAGNLKMIQRTGVGLDSLDMEAIREMGIPLYVNEGVNSESVAEHSLLLILACLRRLVPIAANTKAGGWNKQAQGVRTHELRGKTVGLIGMGHVAQTLVAMLRPFGARILYHDVVRRPEAFERENGLEYVSRDEVFALSDIVSLHCPMTEQTRLMVDRERLASMKDGAILVNTARGPLIDAPALAEALQSGKIGFAGIDVHETEPLAADYPLKALENVILTPHVAGITAESFRTMMHDAMRNIEAFEEGRLEEIAPHRYL